MATLRDHEVRARALLSLCTPLVQRARESTRESEERTRLIHLAEQTEAISRCFAVGTHVEVADPGKTLDEFFRLHYESAIRVKVKPVTPGQVRARVAELRRDHAAAMDVLAAAVRKMSGRPERVAEAPALASCTRVHTGDGALWSVPRESPKAIVVSSPADRRVPLKIRMSQADLAKVDAREAAADRRQSAALDSAVRAARVGPSAGR